MIAILIGGRLTETPERRRMKDGRDLVRAKVRARLGRDTFEEWTILAFDRGVQNTLSGMSKGDFVSVQGPPVIRNGRMGGDVVVERTVYPDMCMGLNSSGGLDQ